MVFVIAFYPTSYLEVLRCFLLGTDKLITDEDFLITNSHALGERFIM